MARKRRRQRTGKKGRGKSEGAPVEVPDETLGGDRTPVVDLDEPIGAASVDVGGATGHAVHDLDADDDTPIIDLDDAESDAGADDVLRLIAQTLAIGLAEEADAEPDEPAIDLDADLEEVLEPEAAATAGRDTRASEPTTPREPLAAATELPSAAESAGDSGASHAEPSDADDGGRGAPARVTPTTAGEAARPPIDLGPVSSSAVRDRLLAEALAHAAHQDARYRVPFSGPTSVARWKRLAAGVILLIAVVAAVAPPGWARPDPPAQLGAAERAHGLRLALVLQAQQVEAFRVRMQRLPTALDEVGATLPGVRYVRSGNRAYQLIAYEADGNAIVYDSATPIDAPGTLGAGWAAPEVAP